MRRTATCSDFLIHPSTKADKSKRVSNKGNKRMGASSLNTTILRRLKPSMPDSCYRKRRGAVIEGSGKSSSSLVANTPSNPSTHLQVRLFMACRSPIQEGNEQPHPPLRKRTYPEGSMRSYRKAPHCFSRHAHSKYIPGVFFCLSVFRWINGDLQGIHKVECTTQCLNNCFFDRPKEC